MLGLALSIAWLLGAPTWIGFLGWALDAADGLVARSLRAESKYGAALDWHADVAITVVLAAKMSPLVLALVVPWMAAAHVRSWRCSLRSTMMLITIALEAMR
jgi:phosphatidylglycerophosphate synthase